jgi:hypothetical protein
MSQHIEKLIEEIQNKIIDTIILQDELEEDLRELVEFKPRHFIATRDLNGMFSAGDRFVESWPEFLQRESHGETDGGIGTNLFDDYGGLAAFFQEIIEEN